jgi:transmembrane sensor
LAGETRCEGYLEAVSHLWRQCGETTYFSLLEPRLPMSGQVDPSAEKALRDAAIAWLVRVQSDQANSDDWTALTDWLEASDANLAAFDNVERLSAELHDQRGEIQKALLLRPLDGGQVVSFGVRRDRRQRWLPAAAFAAAAMVVAALMAGPPIWRDFTGSPNSYQTQRGETRLLTLADGSQVRLDASSSLVVQQGWRSRRVTLVHGEASFDVTKDPARPFLIRVGDQQVRVVGTQFNIRHYDDAVDVTVRRGVVEVWPVSLGRTAAIRLVKGQTLHQAKGDASGVAQSVDPDVAFAWTEGRLIYDNRPLSEVIADLNRRYAIPIHLSAKAASQAFSGVLILDDEDAVVRRLAAYGHLKAVHREGEIVLG